MDRLALSIALIASLAIAGRADDTPKAESPAAQKLEEDPSKESIDAYMMENIRTLFPLLTSNPDAAEKKVAEMKAVLDSVQPKDEDAKKLLDQARMVMGFYNQRIELRARICRTWRRSCARTRTTRRPSRSISRSSYKSSSRSTTRVRPGRGSSRPSSS